MKVKFRRRERRRARAEQLAFLSKSMRLLNIESEEALLRYCVDKQQKPEHRYRACIILGLLLERKVIPLLLELAVNEENGAVGGAIDALALIRSRRATRTLMGIVKNSKSEAHRQAAIVGLGSLGDKRAEQLVSRVLLTEACDQTKVYAAEALGAIYRGRRSVRTLMKALPDPSPSVRWSVLNVLGGIRDVNREELDEIRKYLSDDASVPGLLPAEEAGVAFAAQRALNSWTGRQRRPD